MGKPYSSNFSARPKKIKLQSLLLTSNSRTDKSVAVVGCKDYGFGLRAPRDKKQWALSGPLGALHPGAAGIGEGTEGVSPSVGGVWGASPKKFLEIEPPVAHFRGD